MGDTTLLIFGRCKAGEYAECEPNPAAEQALFMTRGKSLSLVGPILLLEAAGISFLNGRGATRSVPPEGFP